MNTVFYWRTALFVYVLAEYFSSVFTQEDTTKVPVLEGNPLPEIPPIHIQSDGVSQLLHNFKPYKGPRQSSILLSQEVANEISPALSITFSIIFQTSLNQGAIPDLWKSALIVPVYKKAVRRTLPTSVLYH